MSAFKRVFVECCARGHWVKRRRLGDDTRTVRCFFQAVESIAWDVPQTRPTMKTKVLQLGLLVMATLALSQSSRAQSASATGGRLVVDHYLLGSAMNGIGGSISIRTPVERLEMQLSYDRYAGNSLRMAVPCNGSSQPFACGSEPTRDRSSLYLVSAGPILKLIRTPEFQLSVLGQVQGGGVNSDSYGLNTYRSLATSSTLWGVAGGFTAGWRPSVTLPIAINATATSGRLGTGNSSVADAYRPFDGRSFRTHRMSIGVTYLIFR